MLVDRYIKAIKDPRRRQLLETAVKMGIKIKVISAKHHILELSYKGKKHKLYWERPHLSQRPGTFFTKDKEMTKIILKECGINVPRGIVSQSVADSVKAIKKEKLNFPIVVKPVDAAKGYGVTVGIENIAQMKRAIQEVKKFLTCTTMKCEEGWIIEEMQPGKDFRVLVLNGKAVACIERTPAHVIGDGCSTIEQLVSKFNAGRQKRYKLIVDSEIKMELRKNKLKLNSVLEKGRYLQLRANANISSGGIATDHTEQMSQRFKKIAEKSAECIGLFFTGIDILTNDITSNNPRQSYVVIEANGAPDYDIHEKPVAQGKGVDVTRLILKAMLGIK